MGRLEDCGESLRRGASTKRGDEPEERPEGRMGSDSGAAVMRRSFVELALHRARSGSGSRPAVQERRTWSLPVSDLLAVVQSTPFVVVGGVATRRGWPRQWRVSGARRMACRSSTCLIWY